MVDRDTERCAITQKYMNFHKKNIEEREWRKRRIMESSFDSLIKIVAPRN